MNTILRNLGLSADRVALMLVPPPGQKVGRRGLPAGAVSLMYADYQRGLSTRQIARRYQRKPQAIWQMFHRRKLEMRPGPKTQSLETKARIVWRGETWTPSHGGYRPTRGDRTRLLHREMWQAWTGRKIPEGWQVSFKNGDFEDFTRGNLFCATADEVTRHHLRRRYPSARLSEEERLKRRRRLGRRLGLERYYRLKKKFKAQGLRCDGKPMIRKFKRLPDVDVRLAGKNLSAAWSAWRNQLAA